ncbi:MAG: ribosome biogenesis GTPase Der [Deltaproteobacteria bacterium]|nr:ribosome biogenesis GTPase Der [Deltaproteobacteria bacterium]
MPPVIAIIGRPNVGKSTLFNRLSHKKKAIVINEPGATRDRNYADCAWNDKPFLLIDTGGFEPASTQGIMSQMREQTLLAMEEADVIIFLMDGRDGLTPSDREIAGLLRATGKAVFYVVNKIDGPRHENLAHEFYGLGIETLYPLSAEHGYGIDELMDGVAVHLSEPKEAAEEDEPPIRIAVIGRPNVGKSSLVNKILGYERTIVNPLPGTTRDAIDTPFQVGGHRYLLIDTAGIRRKSRVSLTLEKYSVVHALKAMERCDIALVLVDADEGITEQDVKIAGLTLEKGTAAIIVVNKWDMVKKDDRTVGAYVRDIKDDLKFMDFAPIIFISALTGQRVSKIFGLVNSVYAQYTKRVGTPELNKTMREIIAANPPSRFQNREVQFGYMTQVSVKPPSFVFFTRQPKSIHFSYERFLVNRIRESFGFDQVPIRIIFRKKT